MKRQWDRGHGPCPVARGRRPCLSPVSSSREIRGGKGVARGAQLLLCPRSASGNDVGSSGEPEAAILDEGLQSVLNVRYKCLDGRLWYRTPSRPIHVHLILDEVCRCREVRDLR